MPKKKSKSQRRNDIDEVEKKFTKVVFTEEEMIRNREEKRNQPNFKKIPFKCDSCVLGFTRQDTYDLHMEKKHHEVRKWCVMAFRFCFALSQKYSNTFFY